MKRSFVKITVNYKTLLNLVVFATILYIMIIKYQKRDYYFINDNPQNKMIKKEIKILLWTHLRCNIKGYHKNDCAPFEVFLRGNQVFKTHKCQYQNCFFYKMFSEVPNEEYDAIMFNGRPIRAMKTQEFPRQKERKPNQRYIFVNLESSARFPVCQEHFDGFFNWTMTYRLDSDIPWTYFVVKDMKGQIVAPSTDVQWKKQVQAIDEKLKKRLQGKTKLAAWFVGRCFRCNNRLKFVQKLNRELERLSNQTVDIYGPCGTLQCYRNESDRCNRLVKNDYLFYLALENSFAKDYVSEKTMTALQNYAVPIVYGEADYSKFLPPGSYIDGRKLGPELLARTMIQLFMNRTKYHDFFKWRNQYSIHDHFSHPGPACQLCAKLNQDQSISSYQEFRRWWNKDFNITNQCLGKPEYWPL